MKRLLLVNTNTEKAPYPVPPLGLCLIAGNISHSYNVTVFDAASGAVEDLINHIGAVNPDYIGISIRNIDNVMMNRPVYYFEGIMETFIKAIKLNSSAQLILGGSGFSIFPELILEKCGIDYGIIGEGESSLPALLNCLERKQEPAGIPGVVYRKNGGIVKHQPVFSLPFTRIPVSGIYNWLDLNAYSLRGSYPVQTKRGCSFSCIYCSYPNLEGKNYRLRDPADIADEIEEAQMNIGSMSFEFVDSTFNSPPGHAESICSELIKRKINVQLRTMGINPQYTSKTLFALMKKAGFRQIDCTPDTASPRMLKSLKKNFTMQQLRQCAQYIKSTDMPTMWFFLFGGPGENTETVLETFDFIDHYVADEDMVLIVKACVSYLKPNCLRWQ